MKKRLKVAVTGAAGQIGYQLIFRIASGQMFGPQTELELHLLEVEQALGSLRGTLMELEDCAFPLLKSVQYGSNADAAMRDVDWAILVGAVPRKGDMQRSDLLRVNGKIFTEQGRAIEANAADDVRIFVVGNPCNTNCLIAMNNAPSVPTDRFFAMTTLDELRARTQLAKKAGVDVTEISQMIIWGNHSRDAISRFRAREDRRQTGGGGHRRPAVVGGQVHHDRAKPRYPGDPSPPGILGCIGRPRRSDGRL